MLDAGNVRNVLDYSNRWDFPQRSLSIQFANTKPCESAPLLSRESFYELHQATQGNARRTFRNPRLLIFCPSGAGDVEMDPRCLLGKFLQKHGCGDGSAPATAGVHDVGDRTANVLF